MKKKGYKGRCEKRSLSKCVGVCRTYSDLQSAYADVLEADPQVKEFQCNVLLEGLSIGEYTTDFLCTMQDGSEANLPYHPQPRCSQGSRTLVVVSDYLKENRKQEVFFKW